MSCQHNGISSSPKDAGTTCIAYEKVVQRVAICTSSWFDPFQANSNLCHWVSGKLPTEEIKSDLLMARNIGQAAVEEFISERLDETRQNDFFHTISKLKLKTFASLDQKKPSKANSQTTVFKATRELFGRL